MASKVFCGFVPEEVIEQILVRIPCTKSILRCSLVCKLWYFLIKSSRFKKTHLCSPNNTKYLLFHTSAFRHGGTVYEYSLYSDSDPSVNCVPLVFPLGLKEVKVHGCCNGLICYSKFREFRANIYLWNPFVRKFKILPKCQKKYYHHHVAETIGFLFDKEKNDYKVVKIIYTEVASSVEVYILRSNSWKIIGNSCPGYTRFSIREHNIVYAKGTLHWLAEDWQGWKIVSLNMHNAKFPEELINKTSWTGGLDLKVVDDNSFVILRRIGLSSVCIVKVHDGSLELLYTDLDKRSNNCLYLIGFRNNGEALVHVRSNAPFQPAKDTFQLTPDKIVSYDFGAKQLTDFVFDRNNLLSAHPLVETLVLLDESDVSVFGREEEMVGILNPLFGEDFEP